MYQLVLMDIRIKVSIRALAIVSKDFPLRRRRYEAELTILEIVYQYSFAISGNLTQMLILKLMNS